MEGLTDHVGLGMLQLLRRVWLRLLEAQEVEQVALGRRPRGVGGERLLLLLGVAADRTLFGRSMVDAAR